MLSLNTVVQKMLYELGAELIAAARSGDGATLLLIPHTSGEKPTVLINGTRIPDVLISPPLCDEMGKFVRSMHRAVGLAAPEPPPEPIQKPATLAPNVPHVHHRGD